MAADKDYTLHLSRILNSYTPVASPAVELILENGSVEMFRKNEVVFPEKRYNAFEYFQIEGISHRFNTDKDRQVLTTCIYQNENVITPHFARTLNGQSIFTLQALTNCLYIRIPAGTLSELMDQNQQLRRFGRSVVEKEFIRNLNYEVLFRSYSAKDRLIYFRNNYPRLENLIPHTVIASFLGITPVSFSRLRHEMAKVQD